MRSANFWVKRLVGEFRIRHRRRELTQQLATALGHPITLLPAGSGGNDSIYYLRTEGVTTGVVRLLNPFKVGRGRFFRALKRKRGPVNPWQRVDAVARMEREWQLCCQLADLGLASQPLWRSRDVTVFAYHPGPRLARLISSGDNDQIWRWLDLAVAGLASIHARGVAHMDAKVENVLADRREQTVCFIDWDCVPDPALGLAQQQAFDYLKLLSSALALVPPSVRHDSSRWTQMFAPHVPPAVGEANTRSLLELRSVRYLMREPALCEALHGVFPALRAA